MKHNDLNGLLRRVPGAMATISLAMLIGSTPAAAATFDGPICMQRVYVGPGTTVTNANRLNCTAGDVRLSRAIRTDRSSCTRGERFDLQATFEVIVTANTRYDPAFFFRTDGGPNARGDGPNATGECSVTALENDRSPALNLDNDTVGDLNSGTYEIDMTFEDVLCEGNDAGKLMLPNCTSWHSNSSTVASISDVFTWGPETKSKCRCDDNFFLDIDVEAPSIAVTKTAIPVYLGQYVGGEVTFRVKVENENEFESIQITSMTDTRWYPGSDPDTDHYDDWEDLLLLGPGSGPEGETCAALSGYILGPGAYVECAFTDYVQGGNAGETYTNTAEVSAIQVGTGAPVSGEDTAQVTLTNELPEPTVTKMALDVTSCTVAVRYSVAVHNGSAYEAITVNALSDDLFGDITSTSAQITATTCVAGGPPIAVGGTYTCVFTALIEEDNCDIRHVNTVTATGVDNDGFAFDAVDSDPVVVRIKQRYPSTTSDSEE